MKAGRLPSPARLHHSTNAVTPPLQALAPQHFLYFLPEPHGHSSLRPTFGWARVTVLVRAASSPAAVAPWLGPVKVIDVGRRWRRCCNCSGACSATTWRLKSVRTVAV